MTLRKDTYSVLHLESIALSAAAHLESSIWRWRFTVRAVAGVHLYALTLHLILHKTPELSQQQKEAALCLFNSRS